MYTCEKVSLQQFLKNVSRACVCNGSELHNFSAQRLKAAFYLFWEWPVLKDLHDFVCWQGVKNTKMWTLRLVSGVGRRIVKTLSQT